MAFKNEDRSSGIISGPAIFRKVSDENFEKLIDQVKGLTVEERTNAARNNIATIVSKFHFIWDDDPQAWIQPFMLFLIASTRLACAGLTSVSAEKKRQIANYFQDIQAIKDIIEKEDKHYDFNEFNDDQYRMLVEPFLTASLEPLTSDYPVILFTYMLLAACADTVNENGLKAIRKLREDYIDYALLKKEGRVEEFTGTLDRSLFMSPEEIKKAEEARKKAEAEAAQKEAEERMAQLGKLKTLKVGDSFLFGSYPQSNRKASERVEWTVLDKSGSKILVVSKHVLDNQSFHKSKVTTPWSESLIRTWLDKTFLSKAFIPEEQELIATTTINEPDSAGVKHTTSDRVFLLSEEETKKYMPTPESRSAEGTRVAGNSYWGLRSYKKGADSFQYYTANGRLMSNKFGDNGFTNSNYDCTLGVRPAMWLLTSVMTPEEKKKAEEEARRAKEKVEAEEKARKEAEARRKAEEERKRQELEAAKKKYEADHRAWESECSAIKVKREEWVTAKIAEEKKQLEIAAQKKRDDAVTAANTRKAEAEKKKSEAEATLASLGMFKFGEKKTQKAIIEETTKIVCDAQNAVTSAETTYKSEMAESGKKADNKAIVFRNEATKEYPFPAEPVRPRG